MTASACAAVPVMTLPGARTIFELARLLGRAAARDGWAETLTEARRPDPLDAEAAR